jgi:predicted Rossmann fold nucleotide-binding protein DprA/Smf involved in DNA uptake
MGRNKYVYELSDWALIVSSSHMKGGTWAGAAESLRKNIAPVFVRASGNVPEGNGKLIESGAVPFSEDEMDSTIDLRSWFSSHMPQAPPVQLDVFSRTAVGDAPEAAISASNVQPQVDLRVPSEDGKKELVEAALSVIEKQLLSPKTEKELADTLDLSAGQLKKWLKEAVALGRIAKVKSKKAGTRYVKQTIKLPFD